MIGSAIRQLAAAREVALLSAAFDEAIVQIWDLARQTQIGEFRTQFAFGGCNLAFEPKGTYVVAGNSAKNGTIAAYEVLSGKEAWKRNGIRYPTHLRFGPSGHQISCTIDNRVVELLDTKTGSTNRVLKGVRRYFEGQSGQTLAVPSSSSAYLLRTGATAPVAEFQIERLTFAVLDAAFGPDCLYLTESTGPLRCIDCATGSERWRFNPPAGSHVLRLHYNADDQMTYGVLWHYEKGAFRYLVRFDPRTGEMEHISALSSWEEEFIASDHRLVTSSGEIVDLRSGDIVGSLSFPKREYPD